MDIMTKNRIRHLPIVSENDKSAWRHFYRRPREVGGLRQEETIEHLQNYISSNYPT